MSKNQPYYIVEVTSMSTTLQKFQEAQAGVTKAQEAYDNDESRSTELELALEKAKLELAQQKLNLAEETLKDLDYQIKTGLPADLAAKQKDLRKAKDDVTRNIRANEVAAVQHHIEQFPLKRPKVVNTISQAKEELAAAKASVQGFELPSGSPSKFLGLGWWKGASRSSTGSLPNERSSLLSVDSASTGRRSLPDLK